MPVQSSETEDEHIGLWRRVKVREREREREQERDRESKWEMHSILRIFERLK